MQPWPVATVGWGVAVMFVSAVANSVVARMLFKVGKETDSVALIADGWHLRTDVYTSAGVMAGLAVIWVGESLFPDIEFHWLDPVAAIGVALLIIKAAWDLTRQSAGGLMDETLPPEEEEEIRRLICSQQPVVHGYHQLRTRKAGHYRFIEVHIQVDGRMSVANRPPPQPGPGQADQGAFPLCDGHGPYRTLRRQMRGEMSGGLPPDRGGADPPPGNRRMTDRNHRKERSCASPSWDRPPSAQRSWKHWPTAANR